MLSRRRHVGELYLADISVPAALYEQRLGLEVGPLFAQSKVVRLALKKLKALVFRATVPLPPAASTPRTS